MDERDLSENTTHASQEESMAENTTPASNQPIIINGEVCTPETHCFKDGKVVLKKDGSPRRKPGPSIGSKYKKGGDEAVAADLAQLEAADKVPLSVGKADAVPATLEEVAASAAMNIAQAHAPVEPPKPTKLAPITATVTRTYGKIGKPEAQDEVIEVKGFVTQPAQVEIGYGLTLNIGNYESARVDVRITVPCYKEETDAAYDYAKTWAEERVRREVDSVRKLATPQKSNPF